MPDLTAGFDLALDETTDETPLAAPPLVSKEVAIAQADKSLVPPARLTAAQQQAHTNAVQFLDAILDKDPTGVEFTKAVAQVDTLGDDVIQKTTDASNRLLDKPMQQNNGDAPQAKVATTLSELRHQVEDFNPSNLTSKRSMLAKVLFKKQVENYFDRYRNPKAQAEIDRITKALRSGEDELQKDNAALQAERENLVKGVTDIRQYIELSRALDAELTQRIAAAKASGVDPETINVWESELQSAIVRKQQDLETHVAVCVQGILSLNLLYKNNMALIRGVHSSLTTTLSALHVAVTISGALTTQRLVLTQINAMRETTSNLLVSNAQLLNQQGAEINQMASDPAVQLDKLAQAFQLTYDAIDKAAQANRERIPVMRQSIDQIETQLQQASKYAAGAKGIVEGAQRTPQLGI